MCFALLNAVLIARSVNTFTIFRLYSALPLISSRGRASLAANSPTSDNLLSFEKSFSEKPLNKSPAFHWKISTLHL